VHVYGDEAGRIVRVRGDGYGVHPWSVDMAFDATKPLGPQTATLLDRVEREVAAAYAVD